MKRDRKPFPLTRRDWIRSARRGGPFWTIAGLLAILGVVIGLVKACTQ